MLMIRSFLMTLFLLLPLVATAQTAKDDVVDFGTPVPLTIVSESGMHEFSVERAVTLDQQARGMMFRETMGPETCLLYTSPSPRDATLSRMPSSA